MPNDAIRIEPERIDDLPLVLGLLQRLGIGEVLDRHLGSGHGNRQGLSYGRLALGLCARIISTQDHRLVSVEAWAQAHQALLTRCLGTPVADKDFSDDRLADLLYALGHDAAVREAIETELAQQMVRAYRLPTEVGRADSTSVSVYHDRAADSEGLLQFGHSKDHRPDLRQYVQALGTLDPAGLPLISETLAGNQADPPLYVPIWRRMVQVIGHTQWLFVGDSKLHSAQNLATIHQAGGWFLTPLQMSGHMPEHLAAWLARRPARLQPVHLSDVAGESQRVGGGYEVAHEVEWTDPESGQSIVVPLRVFMVRRDSFKTKQIAALNERLQRVETALQKLEGRRCDQAAERAAWEAKAQAVVDDAGVADYLSVRVYWRTEQKQKLQGPGRPGPQRRTQTVTHHTAHIRVQRKAKAITAHHQSAGWRAYATNVPAERLSLPQAVEKYAGQWQTEHSFSRLKGDWLQVAPVFLQTDEHIRGLMFILTLILRTFTLMEFVVRRALQARDERIAGLYPGAPHQTTSRPSAERMLLAFEGITLLRVRINGTNHVQLSGLSSLHRQILRLLDLPISLYTSLTDGP